MSAKDVPDDILEQIFVRLDDLKDLIRFKIVCKSWHSFISTPRFATYHLKHSRNSNTKRTRIFIHEEGLRKHLLGSSNGLLCIFTLNDELIVVNPLTRDFKILKYPDDVTLSNRCFLGGFGYDSSSDDYKVILGIRDYKEDNLMRFHVLSLKSNVWKVVGDAKCIFARNLTIGSRGMLCKGALHWFVLDQHKNPLILSFGLSTEEFKEIPQPDDTRYKYTSYDKHLGMVEENLCIYHDYQYNWAEKDTTRGHPNWVMKNYINGKPRWELLPRGHHAHWDNDVALRFKILKYYDRLKRSLFHQGGKECLLNTAEYISAPIYEQSLVSPQVKAERSKSFNWRGQSLGGLKRKWHTQKGSN